MPATVRIPDDLLARVDRLRGDVPRERWVLTKLEQGMQLADAIPVDQAIATARRQRNEAQHRAGLLELRLRMATQHIAALRAQLESGQGGRST